MKKTKAYSLEEDIIEAIENYQKKYNLSSASSALERIILVELPKRTELEEIKSMIKDLKNIRISATEETKEEITIDKETKTEQEPVLKNSDIADSFQNSIDDMPD